MIQAFAPRMPRGFSWVWLAIVAVALAPWTTLAQTPPTPAEKAKPRAADDKPEAKPAPVEETEPTAEIFLDPNAKRTLAIFNPLIATTQMKVATAGDDRAKIQNMAARAINLDADFLKKYIEYFAVELTKRDNLNALLNPPPPPPPPAKGHAPSPPDPKLRNLELAVDALIKPLVDARANNNGDFLNVYTKLLFESSLVKILENNYLSRIDAMIVLGMAGSSAPNALDLYINQLKKQDQVIWVKLWAARGLTNAAKSGTVDLDASKSILAADALITFLDSDPKLPWPAQVRALEALGSLRVATANNPKKIDAASVAMRYLADPEANPEARAWAAWALGSMKVSPALGAYNFMLLGHEIGELTIDLGQQIVHEFDDDPANFDREKDMAAHLTGLLLFQVYPALVGEEGVRDSGLLKSKHPNAGGATNQFLTKVEDKVKAVTREAYELLRAGGANNKGKRNDLDAKIADLKIFMGQTVPKDRHLVPGGSEFPPNPPQEVAGAPGS
jgi:hypothetical protein